MVLEMQAQEADKLGEDEEGVTFPKGVLFIKLDTRKLHLSLFLT